MGLISLPTGNSNFALSAGASAAYDALVKSKLGIETRKNTIEYLRSQIKAPQMAYLFDIELHPDIDPYGVLSKKCVRATLPFPKIESDFHNIGNSKWYFGRNVDIGSITLAFIEEEDGSTKFMLDNWTRRIIHEGGAFYPPKNYKKTIKVNLTDGLNNIIKTFDFKGYYPISISDANLDYTTNSILLYEVTFDGDDVIEK